MSRDAADTDARVEDELVAAGFSNHHVSTLSSTSELPVSPTQSKKRKVVETVPVYMNPFVIQPFQENSLSPPLSITPINAAPRECVPISILLSTMASPTPSSSGKKSHDLVGTISTSRPFRRRIAGLGNKVLFVRVDEGKSLGAVERIGKDVYMLTMLPDYVKVKHIRMICKKGCSTPGLENLSDDVDFLTDDGNIPDYATLDEDEDEDGFWKAIGIDLLPTQIQNPEVDMLVESFSMAPPASADEVAKESKQAEPQDSNTTTSTAATISPLPAPPKNFSTRELVKQFQSLYFEALYVSKSPLTYFAKLTLARFRTSCKGIPEKIIEVLQQMILTVGESDYKYKSGLSHILLELENAHGMDEVTIGLFNPNDPGSEIPIPASIAQSTVGLSSLDHERQYIQRWWNQDADVRLPKLRRKKIDEIKIRETKLQAILALEILAQQQSLATEGGVDVTANRKTSSKAKSKAKRGGANKHDDDAGANLNLLLDVLFDRLYIWQTVSSLDFIITTSAQKADEVREFCLEVVVPFYGSRLPNLTSRLLHKCGGEKPATRDDVPSSPIDSRTHVKKIKQEESSSPIAPTKQKSRPSLKSRSTTDPAGTADAAGVRTRALSSSILKFARVASDLGAKGRKQSAIRGGLLVSNKTLERREIDITAKKK
ncbi:DNA replication regulator SLD3-domain-containing protein [Lipomyces kononenkoae]|uniref:DNA replication regulator SLD3-domain-containing protein n=1 Tax=Lipomyces kononenkoae TaxID=34357 RepID=A0ACC3SYK0_LIPKO